MGNNVHRFVAVALGAVYTVVVLVGTAWTAERSAKKGGMALEPVFALTFGRHTSAQEALTVLVKGHPVQADPAAPGPRPVLEWNTSRTLHWFGQDCILTPVIKGEHALVQTTRTAEGEYVFDFARLDRWIETFLRLGFAQFHGHHVVQWGAVHGIDAASGQRTVLIPSWKSPEFLPFLEAFYRALSAHLRRNGWTHRYLQHQIDETGDVDTYRTLTKLLRQHLPGVRTVDAINKKPEELTQMYPTADGLVGGMRMMAFRDGLQDHALLTLLAARNRVEADALARKMIQTLVRYERQPEAFHAARAELLESLDRQ
jgi:hypothetical protein